MCYVILIMPIIHWWYNNVILLFSLKIEKVEGVYVIYEIILFETKYLYCLYN